LNNRLDDMIIRGFEQAPSERCFWWRGEWWSRGVLDEMVAECEDNLIKSGFKARHRLGLVIPNSPLLLASCVAAWRLGGSVAPVNPQLKYPLLPEYLRSVGVFAAIVNADLGGIAEKIAEVGIPSVTAGLGDSIPPFEGRDVCADADSETAALFHTSGAGGIVKAVPITHGNIITLLTSILEAIPSLDEDDVILNAIPNYHSLGFVIGGMLPLAAGMPQVLVSSFRPPKNALYAIRNAEVTVIPAVPIMLSILLGGERNVAPMSKVKLLFYGGGNLVPGIAERAREIFGVTPLPGYGLTEASSVLAVTQSEEAMKPGTSGRLLRCFDAKVLCDDGSPATFDAEGRLWIRGDAVTAGYYEASGAASERFRDGWFDTQDIVRIDEEGYITLVSPAFDIITSGGMTVYAGEIEAMFQRHPQVERVAVISVPRGKKGEMTRAYVVLKDGGTVKPRELINFGRAHLPNYKAPKSVKILPELPTDNLGRVLKHELRDL